MTTALIVEDSRLARQGLARMLSQTQVFSHIAQAQNADEAEQYLQHSKVDVMFLDIHMPGRTGLELLANLNSLPPIIFTTAYPDYAIASFEYPTIDYLLKPISQDRLEKAIDKLLAKQTQPQSPQISRQFTAQGKVFIKDGDQCHLVALVDISHFESCKNYVIAHFNNTKAFIRKNMATVEASLPPELFFKANRQMLVNLQHIENIALSIADGYDIHLHSGEHIEVSRRNAHRLKHLLSF